LAEGGVDEAGFVFLTVKLDAFKQWMTGAFAIFHFFSFLPSMNDSKDLVKCFESVSFFMESELVAVVS